MEYRRLKRHGLVGKLTHSCHGDGCLTSRVFGNFPPAGSGWHLIENPVFKARRHAVFSTM